MEILKKLTLKGMGVDRDAFLRVAMDADGASVPVARVFGRATTKEDKIGDNGPYTLFKGMFGGVNLLTGQEFKSGHAIFNGPAEGMLAGGVSMLGDEAGEVPFVYEIGVKYMKGVEGSPYQYTCKVIGEEALNLEDPLKDLRSVALGDGVTPALTSGSKSGKKEKATAAA